MFKLGRPKNIAKVEVVPEPEVKPEIPTPVATEKVYRIVEGELLESGLIRYIILSNVSLGAIGEEFKVEA
jgi:hypothetical protein